MIYHKPKTCPGCDTQKTTLSFEIPNTGKTRQTKPELRTICNVCYNMGSKVLANQATNNETYRKYGLTINGLPPVFKAYRKFKNKAKRKTK